MQVETSKSKFIDPYVERKTLCRWTAREHQYIDEYWCSRAAQDVQGRRAMKRKKIEFYGSFVGFIMLQVHQREARA
jgi:hypothetical protein